MITVPYDKVVPYSALYIDMTYSCLAKCMWSFLASDDRPALIKQIERACLVDPVNDKLIVSACVRTATDLLFQALDWPRGAEIIMTGVNIPQMVQVIRHSGIIPVPVEIKLENLGPNLEDIKKVCTKNTKGIMISYIYGAKFDASEIIEWCHSQGIFIIEDCAESFEEPRLKVHPLVNFATYSFGTIKTCSAFGGALSVIRKNEVLYRKMMAIQDKYPFITKQFFFKRILKNQIPMVLLNYPKINKISRFVMINFMRFDYKEAVVDSIRGFKIDGNFLETFRIQIPTPMLTLLALRLSTFEISKYQEAMSRLTVGQAMLEKNGISVPGSAVKNRCFWLYPIVVPNPKLTYQMLNARGVDAYMGVTQLDVVESPIGSKYTYPNQTLQFFKNLIYLPLHQEVPLDQVKKICNEVIDVVNIIRRHENQRPNL